MKFLKKLACAAAVAVSFAGAANAAVMNDWVFNPNGTGASNGFTVNEYLDLNGNSFIQQADGTFKQNSVFNISQHDSTGTIPSKYKNVTATIEATGTGTFGTSGFRYTGGTISLYSDRANDYGSANGIYGANNGDLIASFNILSGGGLVDTSGNPIGNGQISIFAQAGAGGLESGYFFRENGQDLSTQSIMAFAFTNANTLKSPSKLLVSELGCQYAGYTQACDYKGQFVNTKEASFYNTNGQLKLDAGEVPEPASLALMGLGLAGFAAARKRRQAK